MQQKKLQLDRKAGWERIQKYCAYQERCHVEVRSKLYDYGLNTNDVESIIVDLIQANFLNEERFAKAYVRGKFRAKQWGRNKIIHALKFKKISPVCIKIGLSEIDDALYQSTLERLIEKKSRDYRSTNNEFVRKNKIASYCVGRGFESDFVWVMLKNHDSV